MADPRILVASDNSVLHPSMFRHCGSLPGLSVVHVKNVDEAVRFEAGGAGQEFLLWVVDLDLPEEAVSRLTSLAAAQGIPWLAVADRYSPALREKAEELDAIDFVVADTGDPERVPRFVERLYKNRFVRVLVVEDSAFMRIFLRRELRRYQFRVHMAGSPEMAMRILEQRPDIIAVIIDYDMPGQNGVELTRGIRRSFRHREICLIGVSGKAPRSISSEFLKNGGDDYLHKPFGREELYCRVLHGVEAVERMLEIRRLERLRRMFLSMLAHDLKSPAGGIVGAANLILDGVCGQVGSEVREMAAVISQAGRRLCSLAANMQDLTQLESGHLEPSLVMSHLDDLIHERARLAEATASAKGIRLDARVGVLPALAFDPDMVARLLDNLLSNAIKFSPPQTLVRLEADMLDEEVVIRVFDEGPGIMPGERHRLFKPFERLSARPTAGEKSLGLGLAIAEGIVNAHGGRIWVESDPGQGAVFCVSLPRSRCDQAGACRIP